MIIKQGDQIKTRKGTYTVKSSDGFIVVTTTLNGSHPVAVYYCDVIEVVTTAPSVPFVDTCVEDGIRYSMQVRIF